MAYGNCWRLFFIIIAACSTQAQQQQWLQQQQQQPLQQQITRDPDAIVFPGQTARPDRFPIRPQGTTPSQQVQGSVANQPTTTSTPNMPDTVANTIYNDCFSQCLTTSQYDPVCGTDNITYTNREKLRCAQRCGKQVQEDRRGTCENNQRVP